MDFPHRHGHGHGRRDDDDDSDDRRAPAPGYGGGREDDYGRHGPAYGAPAPAYGREDDYGRHGPAYGAPAPAYGREDDYGRHAPAPAYGGGREDDYGRHAPAPAYGGGGYGAPAPAAYGGGGREDGYGRHAPAYGGGNVIHVSHESGGDDSRPNYGGGGYGDDTRPHHGGAAPPAARQKTYRIICKAGEDSFSLAARDGKVCLVRTDHDDDTQHWIKDMKFSTRVKDEEGYPAIALVNKATGEALKHSLGQSHPVLLTRYNPDTLEESVLWTESRDVGEGYRCIRMVNNIYLNFDALNGDKDHGGVHDGTTLVLWEWAEGDNQRWKIVAWCSSNRRIYLNHEDETSSGSMKIAYAYASKNDTKYKYANLAMAGLRETWLPVASHTEDAKNCTVGKQQKLSIYLACHACNASIHPYVASGNKLNKLPNRKGRSDGGFPGKCLARTRLAASYLNMHQFIHGKPAHNISFHLKQFSPDLRMVSSSISTNPSSIPQVVTTQRTAMADHLQQRQPKQQHQQQWQLELPPGFRFHPTDEEIITFYLTPKVLDRTFVAIAIGEVDLNKCEPWDLPDKAKMGEKEWYFYCQKDRKYPTGMRTNRATEAGYWKATGKDKEIFAPPPPVLVGMKKTLVFYKGRAPRGEKTNWVMHEYRIETRKEDVPYATSSATAALINAAAKDEWVVCRIFHKNSGIKKVVMPSYTMAAMPMFMGGAEQQQSFVVDSGTLPPLVDYTTSSSTLAPPPHLHASSYQMNASGTGTSMMGSASLPMMNGHYFGNQGNHQMMGPPPLMSFYHQQQQQMQMMDQGFMAGAGPASGPSSMVSQEDTGTVLSNNDQSNAGTPAAEISSVNMGMDGMWKY